MSDTTADRTGGARNTETRYGTVSKVFHWLTALLILAAFPLGVVAERWPLEPDSALAFKAQLFSVHKTVGISVFFVALLRILWAMTQRKPAPIHPERRTETLVAETVHWSLYASLVVVPLSGWVHHAASTGFAPILWPFGQSLPLVPQSETWYAASGAVHWVFTKVLLAAVLLHVAGALKHAFLDRDGTLARMWFGSTHAGVAGADHTHVRPALIAAAIFLAGFALSWSMVPENEAQPQETASAVAPAEGGNWAVEDGALTFTVQQFGNAVEGRFSDWSAEITFEEETTDGTHGSVEVNIAIGSMTVGSVTEEALKPTYFDVEAHPTATFVANILPGDTDGQFRAEGTLTLKGTEAPITLPFTLDITGDAAQMDGGVTVNRSTWGIGGESATPVGPEVTIDVSLTATRSE